MIDAGTAMRMLEASADCMKVIDLDGKVVALNNAGRLLFAFEQPETFTSRPWRDMWPDVSRAKVDAAIADAKSGKIARFAAFRPTLELTPKWWDVVLSPVHDDSGQVVSLLSVSREVTLQAEAESRFRALADNMAQLAWMADSAGNIFWFNRRWFDYTGTDPHRSIEAADWLPALHPEHADRIAAKFHDAIAARTEVEETFPIRAADGSYGWFLCRIVPVCNEQGSVDLWCGTFTDITEQRSLGARLRQKARLIELSHEAILAWDLDSHEIVLWNRGCEELYGYARTEAISARSHDLLQTRFAAGAKDIEAALRADGVWSGSMMQRHKDGRVVAVDSRQELMRIDGRNIALETNRDITDWVQAERTRELLTGELYHRVNNVLAIVQSMAAQTARSVDTKEQFVASFNARLLALSGTHSVLTSSNWRSADITSLVYSQLGATLGDTSRVAVEGPEAALPAQTAIQLGLVLCELASNALKHGALSDPRGRVGVSWTIAGEDADRRLNMVWQELGGPDVQPPETRRFGLTLIERTKTLPYLQLELDFARAGLVCRIMANLPEVKRETNYFGFAKTRTTPHAPK